MVARVLAPVLAPEPQLELELGRVLAPEFAAVLLPEPEPRPGLEA